MTFWANLVNLYICQDNNNGPDFVWERPLGAAGHGAKSDAEGVINVQQVVAEFRSFSDVSGSGDQRGWLYVSFDHIDRKSVPEWRGPAAILALAKLALRRNSGVGTATAGAGNWWKQVTYVGLMPLPPIAPFWGG